MTKLPPYQEKIKNDFGKIIKNTKNNTLLTCLTNTARQKHNMSVANNATKIENKDENKDENIERIKGFAKNLYKNSCDGCKERINHGCCEICSRHYLDLYKKI